MKTPAATKITTSALDSLNFNNTAANPQIRWTRIEYLRTAFALGSHRLHLIDTSEEPLTFCVERWGLVKHLPTIDAARRFLEQIGGRL
jgi:hypothetical protein